MQASKQINSNGFKLSLDVVVNPKAFLSTIFFEFKTTEKELLNALLMKYKYEKVSKAGINPNNRIVNAIVGNCCICLVAAAEYVYQNVTLLISYLAKTDIKGEVKKRTSGKYSKLMKDIANINVTIVGKTKRLIAQLTSPDKKLEEKIKNSLDKIQIKDRDDITGSLNEEYDNAELNDVDDTTMMYLSVILGDISCSFKKNGKQLQISFMSKSDEQKFKDLIMHKERIIYQTQVRSFLWQSGTIGSPSAKDKGGVKYKEKIDNLMRSENALAYIYSSLRGFEYKFKTKDDIKNVDNDALSNILRLR